MNLPFLYTRKEIAKLSDDVTYSDTAQVDKHRYTLVEKTYFGLIKRRYCRYRTSVRYRNPYFNPERAVYSRIIKPWLAYNDQPLQAYTQNSTP